MANTLFVYTIYVISRIHFVASFVVVDALVFFFFPFSSSSSTRITQIYIKYKLFYFISFVRWQLLVGGIT